MAFLDDNTRRALRDAIKTIEAGTSAEIVVAVRPRLRHWPSAHAAIGVSLGIAALAFSLFSDLEFDLWEILVLPVLIGMLGGLAVELVPALQRALTPKRVRVRDLRDAARAAFYELGVHKTTGRTGLLAFVEIRGRSAALVGDVAVVAKLGQRSLDGMAATIAAAIPEGGEAVARALRALEQPLAKALPRAADDVNELPDEVHLMRPRARGRVAS